jgi:thymidylate synthase (FAD)
MTQIITQLNPDVPPTGSDLGIVNAARKSFGRRSEWDVHREDFGETLVKTLKDKDKRLLEFLARGMTAADFDEFRSSVWLATQDEEVHYDEELTELLWQWRNTPTHDTPFNHGFFSFEVKAPVFVARHLVKHEYLITSEYSRRYITDDVEFYTPDVWRKAAADVKQGSSGEAIITSCVLDYSGEETHPRYAANDVNELALSMYKGMVSAGVAPEQARMVLPQSLMTAWTWSGTLGAFANMCKLRLSSDTQAETRVVAQAVYEELKKQFPVAAPLLVEGVL